jgi:osmotically inducible lipoprotein OsmB
MKRMRLVCVPALMLAGCNMSDRATTGALLGGATGAVVGGVATNSAGGALAGGVIGAAGGAIIGDATRPRCYYSQYYGRTVCRN